MNYRIRLIETEEGWSVSCPHIIMSNGETRLTIPRHNPINSLTMGALAKDAGLTPTAFRNLL